MHLYDTVETYRVGSIVIVLQLIYQELPDNCGAFAVCEPDSRNGFHDGLLKGLSDVEDFAFSRYSLSVRNILKYLRNRSVSAHRSA
jgi:hypothetical protein